jgi:RHS repeat-associated protein
VWQDPNNNNRNNGNLQSTMIYAGAAAPWANLPNVTQTFTYDNVNRLQTAGETDNSSGASNWSRTFNYDPFGNMWVALWAGITPTVNTPLANNYNANNQRADLSYDQVGNTLSLQPPGTKLTYDAENRQVSENGYSYTYDGDGKRVMKTGGGATTVYVYDAAGQLTAEYSTAAASECVTCYLSYDHLGSVRMVTDASGKVISRHDYLPFGEEIPAGTGVARAGGPWGSGDGVTQRFTGKERDSESGLDYFGARYYGSALGRFTSPDEVFADQHPADPQSWNLYGYVRNNPLRSVDANGRADIFLFPPIMFTSKTVNSVGDAGIAFAKSYINDAKEGYNNLSRVVSEVSGGKIDIGHADITPLSADEQSKANGVALAVSIVAGAAGGGEEANVSEGIYEFPDATAPGKTYVEQSGRLPDRLGEHMASGKLDPGTEVTATEVPGGKTTREVAEQKRMDELGGKSSTLGSQTSNQRNSVSPERMKRLENGQSQ